MDEMNETPIEQNPESGLEADAESGANNEMECDGTECGNVIKLDPAAYADKKDGDTVSTTVEGELIEHDGMKFLHVKNADGKPVQEFAPEDAESMDSEDESEGMNDDDIESAMADFSNKNTGLKSYMK